MALSWWGAWRRGRVAAAKRRRAGFRPGVEALEGRALLSAAALDPSFGKGGTVTTPLFNSDDQPYAVAVRPDGRILVAGGTSTASGAGDFAVLAYNADGSPDASFGGGKVTTDFYGGYDSAFGLALDAQGRAVVVGVANHSGVADFALARYNTDGTLDPTFGSGGKVVTDFFGNSNQANAVAIQANGKIVVAGRTSPAGSSNTEFALARYNTDGSLDTTFGQGGKLVNNLGGATTAVVKALSIAPDGRIAVVGSEIVPGITGGTYQAMGVATYLPSGDWTSYGGLSFPHSSSPLATSVLFQPDGKIVVGGTVHRDDTAADDSDFALVRTGGLSGAPFDLSFGNLGFVTTDFAGHYDEVDGLALQPDGKIVAVGQAYLGAPSGGLCDFALARYLPDGTLDPTFGTGGKVLTSIDGGLDMARAVALSPGTNRVVVAGRSAPAGPTGATFSVAAYQGDSAFDFGTATSPVARGYTQVTEATAYSKQRGYGWLAGSSVQSYDRGPTPDPTTSDLLRDFDYTTGKATFAVDVPNGTYSVTIQLGDTVYAHQDMGVSLQGTQVDDVNNAAGQVLTRTYTVTVSGGQLDLGLQAPGGTNPAAVIESLTVSSVLTPPAPGQFDFGTATSPVAAGYRQVTDATAYTPALGYGWLTGSAVLSYDRQTGTDLTRDFVYTTGKATFAVDLPNGTYSVTVQTGDTVYAHSGMGISLQGTQVDTLSTAAGQVLTMTYTVTVTGGQLDLGLQAPSGTNPAAVIEGLEITTSRPSAFDFGTSASPLAAGFIGVTEGTAYRPSTGYGWKAGSDVTSYDRGVGTDLTRDFAYTTTHADFLLDLPNGTYTVTLQVGDTVYAHAGMGISFQGKPVDTVSNAAGQILTKTYVVTVSNGQLDLGLQAPTTGTSPAAVIEGMEVVAGSPAHFDFGTPTSPIAPGYTVATEATAYSSATGFGWLPGSNVKSYDRGVGTTLTEDFCYTDTNATFAVDLPNGWYTVTLQLGDTVYAHQGMGVFLQGQQVDTLSNAAGQIVTRSYAIQVKNGQLDLGLQAQGGLNSTAVLESLDIVNWMP